MLGSTLSLEDRKCLICIYLGRTCYHLHNISVLWCQCREEDNFYVKPLKSRHVSHHETSDETDFSCWWKQTCIKQVHHTQKVRRWYHFRGGMFPGPGYALVWAVDGKAGYCSPVLVVVWKVSRMGSSFLEEIRYKRYCFICGQNQTPDILLYCKDIYKYSSRLEESVSTPAHKYHILTSNRLKHSWL